VGTSPIRRFFCGGFVVFILGVLTAIFGKAAGACKRLINKSAFSTCAVSSLVNTVNPPPPPIRRSPTDPDSPRRAQLRSISLLLPRPRQRLPMFSETPAPVTPIIHPTFAFPTQRRALSFLTGIKEIGAKSRHTSPVSECCPDERNKAKRTSRRFHAARFRSGVLESDG